MTRRPAKARHVPIGKSSNGDFISFDREHEIVATYFLRGSTQSHWIVGPITDFHSRRRRRRLVHFNKDVPTYRRIIPRRHPSIHLSHHQ